MKTTTLLVSNYLFIHSHAFTTSSFPSLSSSTSSRPFTRLQYQSQEQNQDVYAVLNLDPETCTLDVLKATYRQWAKAYHPDSILNPDSTEQERKLANDHFAIINSAYDELTNRFMNGEDYISIAATAVHDEATATVDATTAPNGEQHVGYGPSFGAQQQQQARTQYAKRPARTASSDDERFMPDEVLKQRKTATFQEEPQPFVDYQQQHQQHPYSAHNYSTKAHPAHNGHVYHTHPYQHHDQYNQQQTYQGHDDTYHNQQQYPEYPEPNQMFENYRKFQLFSIGDTVRVRVGKHKGSVGVVVKVSNAMLKIQIGQTNSVTIETKYVKRVLEEDLVEDTSRSHGIHDVKRLSSEEEDTMVWTDVETVRSTDPSSSGNRIPMTLGMDGIYR